eukprot:SAG22_NODE_1854_length_3438_cov_2.648697_3_plen_599_part_00
MFASYKPSAALFSRLGATTTLLRRAAQAVAAAAVRQRAGSVGLDAAAFQSWCAGALGDAHTKALRVLELYFGGGPATVAASGMVALVVHRERRACIRGLQAKDSQHHNGRTASINSFDRDKQRFQARLDVLAADQEENAPPAAPQKKVLKVREKNLEWVPAASESYPLSWGFGHESLGVGFDSEQFDMHATLNRPYPLVADMPNWPSVGTLSVATGQAAPDFIPSFADGVALLLLADGSVYQAGRLPATDGDMSDKMDMFGGPRGPPRPLALKQGRPVKVLLPEPATAVFAGPSAACALTAGGAAYIWGAGADWPGQMLTPDPAMLAMPTPVHTLALGREHIVAIGVDGRAFAAGAGGSGQLGNGSFSDARGGGLHPISLGHLGDESCGPSPAVRTAAASASHTVLVLADGRVAVCGKGGTGPFGGSPPCPIGLPITHRPLLTLPILQHFDLDGDGLLNYSEFSSWAASSGALPAIPSEQQFAQILANMGADEPRKACIDVDGLQRMYRQSGTDVIAHCRALEITVPDAEPSEPAGVCLPTLVSLPPGTFITAASAGDSCTVLITAAGEAWSCGRGPQCGLGTSCSCRPYIQRHRSIG